MGLVFSRLNLDGLHSGRRRSQQDETLYSYSLNKNYFSNYFLMGGERFEVNDPDYLFGDNCDLNFLSCTKPYSLPYKQAQQNLLSNLNSKHKAINKVSSRVNGFGSPFNILTGRHRQSPDLRKQDAQIQNTNSSKGSNSGSEPSKPLVMFVNIRKETLRLVKSVNSSNNDGDISSLTNSIAQNERSNRLSRKYSATSRDSRHSFQRQKQQSTSRRSATGSGSTTATIHPQQGKTNHSEYDEVVDDDERVGISGNSCSRKFESDISSLLSATSSTRSGYTSVKDDGPSTSDDSSDVCDEDFKDALNDTTNLSLKDDDDDESEKTQQQKSLLSETKQTKDKESRYNKTTIGLSEGTYVSNSNEPKVDVPLTKRDEEIELVTGLTSNRKKTARRRDEKSNNEVADVEIEKATRVYNIEFYFDAEVDCSIRVFYFCTRELTSTGITYKPQHATYKSKVYFYKKGLNQKFDQPEHTFQPYLFDEDLLIYKPLDTDGNYNSGAVFPIVIHCVALDGPTPRQSHSLVATIEKSQLDNSYSIKPLKQLIFVDSVQYILQDIYGIEHKQLHASSKHRPSTASEKNKSNLRRKSNSLRSNLNSSNLNLNDNTSLASVDLGLDSRQDRGSLISNQHKSLGSENTFECVVCMSEERDTMLLPCRHLCLCSSCAQSLRYQANSCPICRCPFKAALNLRPIQRHSSTTSTKVNNTTVTTTTTNTNDNNTQTTTKKPLVISSTPSVSTDLSMPGQSSQVSSV